MNLISSTLLFFLFTAVLAANTEESPTTTVTSTSESSSSDKPTPSTLEPTTTTLESTISTTSEITTTPVIPTTTSSSTSSSSTSTTEAPVTTSSPVTSTKAPEPKKCEFNVTEGDATCIRALLQANFLVNVEGKEHSIMLGCNASDSGSTCSSNITQTLVLSEPTYTLTMVFERTGKVVVKNVTFSYNLPSGERGMASNFSENLFSVNAGHSYLCNSKIDIPLGNVTIEVQAVHIQAFLEEGKNFGATEECSADDKVNDVVPIAVGIALAALIIIVLIAYLVGRRRSRQMGYQSV